MSDDYGIMEGTLNPVGGLMFPATRDDVIALARRKHLPPEVVQELHRIPDKVYNNIGEVIAAASNFSH